MKINADFTLPARVVPDVADWVRSPESGVDRLMLDRIGGEVARATSIVRYAPGSRFAAHSHARGEEFLVLDGIFSDEHGDYPTGTYVRNPPGSRHTPGSRGGCRIIVKLRQFDDADRSRVVIDTTQPDAWSDGTLELHRFGSERVWMQSLAKGASLAICALAGGEEYFVVSGAVNHAAGPLPAASWLRLPACAEDRLVASEDTLLWCKSGHLPAGRDSTGG